MKLISWNVNGLRSIYSKGLTNFIETKQPDILCLQETKAWPEQLSLEILEPLDYKSYFSSAQKKGYSGVANYISPRSLKQINSSCTSQIGHDNFDSEGRFLITQLADFNLYNIYFPSGTTGDIRQNFKYDFLDFVYEHLIGLPPEKLNMTIICGDFNICHKDIDIHHPEKASKLELSGFLPRERQWLDKLTGLGFIDSFRLIHGDVKDKYSWWTYRAGARPKNLGWRIDYFWVHKSMAKNIKDAGIYSDVVGSDHAPIYLEISNCS